MHLGVQYIRRARFGKALFLEIVSTGHPALLCASVEWWVIEVDGRVRELMKVRMLA
jgi:hypothetical protein